MSRTLAERAELFWPKVVKTETCWVWVAARVRGRQYGKFATGDGHWTLAHRASWELVNGPIPDGLCVLHHCDNPPCVNPSHLFLGTVADNNRDCVAKGRNRGWWSTPGAVHPMTGARTLSLEQERQVLERWLNGERQVDLASAFGVSQTTISATCRRLSSQSA